MRLTRAGLAAACLAALQAAAQGPDAAPQPLPVAALPAAPRVDGDLSDWGSEGWVSVTVKPALDRKDRPRYGLEEADDRNVTGTLTVQLKAGVAGGRFYLAARWPDATEDKEHQGWEWRGTKYMLARRFDDQFALRLHLAGDFDRTMLSARDYKVDVWLWSAARTNPTGFADDQHHSFTTRATEDAAEYALPGGKTVYLRKQRDAGTPPYRSLPAPRQPMGERLPSFELLKPAGSAADVAAKGQWKAGVWSLEFSRALNTGHADDVVLRAGQKVLGQIAVFNRADAEHKSVSEPLLIDLSALH